MILLIAAVVWGYKMRPYDAACSSISFDIRDKNERLYVTESELRQMLIKQELDPVGQPIDRVSLHRIEKAVLGHPMVRTAECYLTPLNEIKVRLTQRVPLLRVQTAGEVYLIDTDRRVMQARAVVRDSVPVVTGTIGVHMASNQMADFAMWLQKNPYWQQRIRYIQVQNPQMVYLYLRHQPRVVLGSMRDYERKLKKMRTFLDNSAEIIKDKNYTEYDVRFKGQVIGRY
jgi:cell division protein FtsQ